MLSIVTPSYCDIQSVPSLTFSAVNSTPALEYPTWHAFGIDHNPPRENLPFPFPGHEDNTSYPLEGDGPTQLRKLITTPANLRLKDTKQSHPRRAARCEDAHARSPGGEPKMKAGQILHQGTTVYFHAIILCIESGDYLEIKLPDSPVQARTLAYPHRAAA